MRKTHRGAGHVNGVGRGEIIYVDDTSAGIARYRRGNGFAYRLSDGSSLRDAEQLRRIRALAIPPAYTNVWICPDPRGHVQATGRDARGRKQYRYHTEWAKARETNKFDRLTEFAAALPTLRRQVMRDLAMPVGRHVGRESVLATIVRLLDTTLVRVGNEEYARSNGSYGLTTLRNRHAAVQGTQLRLRFRGKSGVSHEVTIDDPRVARVVGRCQSLPGQELFQYLDDTGQVRSIDSSDVNAYIRAASGGEFSAKVFRTWHGSVQALALATAALDEDPSTHGGRGLALAVLKEVSRRLGNTLAVCRKAYVHPRVLELLSGHLDRTASLAEPIGRKAGLSVDERRLVGFLSSRSAAQSTQPDRLHR